ncbi:MAG TPA: hypothetical protein PLK94_14730 [Alphaproteobacteria bacterium]|nr:hypothetical protein [Alphaproteobacteria bacterium]
MAFDNTGYPIAAIQTFGCFTKIWNEAWRFERMMHDIPEIEHKHVDLLQQLPNPAQYSDYGLVINLFDADEKGIGEAISANSTQNTGQFPLNIYLGESNYPERHADFPFSRGNPTFILQKQSNAPSCEEDATENGNACSDSRKTQTLPISTSASQWMMNSVIDISMPILVGGLICLDLADIKQVFHDMGYGRYSSIEFPNYEYHKIILGDDIGFPHSVYMSIVFNEEIVLAHVNNCAEAIAKQLPENANIIFSANPTPYDTGLTRIGVFTNGR